MSVFYQAQFEHLFPIPLLAFERIDALRHLAPEQVIGQVLAECCNKPKPTPEEITYFIRRVQGEVSQAEQQIAPSESISTHTTSRTLGTSFNKLVSSMDTSRLLLWACNWDYQKAKYLYTQVDKTIAKQVVDDFLKVTQETNTYTFEATLYGFGGSYTEDSGNDPDDIDLTQLDASSIMSALM